MTQTFKVKQHIIHSNHLKWFPNFGNRTKRTDEMRWFDLFIQIISDMIFFDGVLIKLTASGKS